MKTAFTLLYTVSFIICATPLFAANSFGTRWHNEASDTTKITQILIDASAIDNPSPNELIAYIGKKFIDTPYAPGTLEGQPEMLTVNLDEMDCTTFVEFTIALAMTINENRNSWQDCLYNLEKLRYRQGKINGYASRLHYISDWIIDNTHRGNITEVTDRFPSAATQIKTLDFMTSHRDLYPALKDSTEYERMKSAEIGYRSHRYHYIKSADLMGKRGSSWLKSGDVIAFTTKTPGLDVTHMGIIIIEDGTPLLLHASSKGGKVMIDPLPLSEYLRKNRNITGGRIIRIPTHR